MARSASIPYDGEACAESIHRALTMSDGERRARMTALRRRVMEHDVHAWARTFVDRLTSVTSPPPDRLEPPLLIALSTARRRGPLHLLLDYDGTLVPLARSPELAAPDEDALTLLRIVASTPGLRVDLVSGRPRETLEQWFGDFPIGLWAEHGFWQRRDGDWIAATRMAPDWLDRLRPLLEQFTAATPGSQVELKSASIAWHYRRAQREFGARQAHELRMLLGDALSNQPLEVLEGDKVIEVRLRGVNKGLVVRHLLEQAEPGTTVAAIGDDRTRRRHLPGPAIRTPDGRGRPPPNASGVSRAGLQSGAAAAPNACRHGGQIAHASFLASVART